MTRQLTYAFRAPGGYLFDIIMRGDGLPQNASQIELVYFLKCAIGTGNVIDVRGPEEVDAEVADVPLERSGAK